MNYQVCVALSRKKKKLSAFKCIFYECLIYIWFSLHHYIISKIKTSQRRFWFRVFCKKDKKLPKIKYSSTLIFISLFAQFLPKFLDYIWMENIFRTYILCPITGLPEHYYLKCFKLNITWTNAKGVCRKIPK